METEGKGVGLVDDMPRMRVVYVEAAFDCVSFVLPSKDLTASVQLAMKHGVNEASKQLGLPKKHLHALPSRPLVKPDGSPVPVEEWVNNHFIVIKMQQDKEEEGLLGKYRKQHAFLEDILRKGITDVDVTTSKKVVNDVPEEVRLLKQENASLKAENKSLKAELETMQKKIAHLSGMDLVMVQNMLETCCAKCRMLLSQRNVHIPDDWNELIHDPICIGVLRDAGLTNGLLATRYGKKSQQKKGSKVAHNITESPEAYATIVCKMHGQQREQMMNVFEFVFESRAEDIAFEDI